MDSEAPKPLISDLVLNSDLVLDPSDIIAVSKEIGNTLSGISNADTKWDEFAIELLGTEDFSQIKKNYTDFVDRCSALLKNWKNITEEPRWEQVVAVLRKIKLNGPAGKLNKALTSLKERGLRQLLQQEVGHTQDETAKFKKEPEKSEKQSDIDETPTTQDLLSDLQGLNNWETFGHFLLPKDQGHLVERIKRDRQGVDSCKTALYQEFFKVGVVTWETVINALEKSGEVNIANQVKKKH